MRDVRFDRYGGVDVLEVREVEAPVATPGRVLVAVKAAGINPGEIAIREGRLHERWPATFPSGEGTDFAGVVRSVGEDVPAFSEGDEVLGWTEERASQAELVGVPSDQLTAKPASVSWEVAGSLFVAGMAAYACVQAVAPQPGETIVVSAAAGGGGSPPRPPPPPAASARSPSSSPAGREHESSGWPASATTSGFAGTTSFPSPTAKDSGRGSAML